MSEKNDEIHACEICEICEICDSQLGVETHVFKWHCRPKPKYHQPDYMTTLCVELCNSCWSIVKPEGPCPVERLIGWDKWDALDGIFFRIEDYHKK